jgi:hypothetical protein
MQIEQHLLNQQRFSRRQDEIYPSSHLDMITSTDLPTTEQVQILLKPTYRGLQNICSFLVKEHHLDLTLRSGLFLYANFSLMSAAVWRTMVAVSGQMAREQYSYLSGRVYLY